MAYFNLFLLFNDIIVCKLKLLIGLDDNARALGSGSGGFLLIIVIFQGQCRVNWPIYDYIIFFLITDFLRRQFNINDWCKVCCFILIKLTMRGHHLLLLLELVELRLVELWWL